MTSLAVCDLNAALAALEGDRELFSRMIRIFIAETPALLHEARQSVEHKDGQRLDRAAHTMRGAICNFAATNAFAAASRLEAAGRDNNWRAAGAAYSELENEMRDLIDVLADFAGSKAQ